MAATEATANDIELSCSCGKVRGVVSSAKASAGNYCRCYCRYCQAFARHLGQADTVLDGHGGTDILQLAPSGLTITGGREHIACLQLTERGPLRWYAACCRSLLANTAGSAKLPFLGLIVATLQKTTPPAELDAVFGPVRYRIFASAATGDRSTLDAANGVPLGMLVNAVGRLIVNRLRGEQRRSPFFDAGTLAPLAKPERVNMADVGATRPADN